MLLAIDVGNTNIEAGLFSLDNEGEHAIITSFRCSTNLNATIDEIGVTLSSLLFFNKVDCRKIKAIICSSVVPPLSSTIMKMSAKYFDCKFLLVTHEIETGLTFAYDAPSEIGADRIVNAVSTNVIYKGPAIIIDFGTATTFCLLSENSEYLGGIIVPGIKTSLEALTQKTTKLPKIELTVPERVIGRTTHAGMVSGIYYSTISIVEGIIDRIKKEVGYDKIKVIGTGGLCNFVAEGTNVFDVIDPLLTLKGLSILYHLNNSKL